MAAVAVPAETEGRGPRAGGGRGEGGRVRRGGAAGGIRGEGGVRVGEGDRDRDRGKGRGTETGGSARVAAAGQSRSESSLAPHAMTTPSCLRATRSRDHGSWRLQNGGGGGGGGGGGTRSWISFLWFIPTTSGFALYRAAMTRKEAIQSEVE